MTGEQRDRQISRQFYFLRARYYDPATGRFLSQDPIPAGNLYAYAENNPVNGTDRSGAFCPVCGAAGALGGAAAGAVATYAADVFEDVHSPADLIKPQTYFPDISWQTYLANTAQGAAVGGVCGFAFESGVACVGLATFGTSLGRQEIENAGVVPWKLDICEAGVEGLFAAGGVAFAKSLFPYKVPGRYPLWHNAAFLLGKHAEREYWENLYGLPLAAAGGVFSHACNPDSATAASTKE